LQYKHKNVIKTAEDWRAARTNFEFVRRAIYCGSFIPLYQAGKQMIPDTASGQGGPE